MNGEKYITIGNNIRRLRKKQYYSQEKLAELLDISTNHLHRVETAKSRISLPLLLKMSEVFKVEISELLKEECLIKQEALQEIEEILVKSNEKEKEIIRQTVINLYYILKTVDV